MSEKKYFFVADTVQKVLAESGQTTYGTDAVFYAKGRDSVGDGGGGYFQVTQSAAATDGGACFAFDADYSAEQSEQKNGFATWPLSQTDLIWGTVGLRYGPDPNDVLSDFDMHGHASGELTEKPAGWVDYKNGELLDGVGNPADFLANGLGDSRDNYDILYKYATSDRRLERIHPPNEVNIDWWGAPEADPQNPKSAGSHLRWAMNRAKNAYDNTPYNWIYVNIPKEYYYQHAIVLMDGLMLRGTGPSRSVPNRSFTVNGALRLMPGDSVDYTKAGAVYYKKDDYDPVADHDEYNYLGSGVQQTNIKNQTDAVGPIGFYNIELNGNWLNNEEVFTTSGFSGIQTYLQNSGDWNAFYTSGSGGEAYTADLPLHMKNVYAHQFGSNSFAGSGADFNPNGCAYKVQWMGGPSENVHLVDAVRNHQIYSVPGETKNWSIDGAFWASPMKLGTRKDWPTTYKDIDILSVPDQPYGYNIRNVWSTNGVNILVDGLTINMTDQGTQNQVMQQIAIDQNGQYYLSQRGHNGNTYKNVTIELPDEDAPNELQLPLNVFFSQHGYVLWKNVTINDNGGAMILGGGQHQYNVRYENVTIDPIGSIDPVPDPTQVSDTYRVMVVGGFDYDDRVAEAMRQELVNVDYNRDFNCSWLQVNGPTGGGNHPFDRYSVDGSVANQNPNGRGKFLRVPNDEVKPSHTWFRWFMDNMTFNVNSTLHQWTGAGSVIRMRNCQDRNGRTSEETGTYTSDANDEGDSEVVIPTSLLSNPGETSATVTSGTPNVTGVTVQNGPVDPELKVSLDQSIGTGNTIDVDYTARITPADEYKTTGAFIARPVSNKSYTSGNGPFTVDLRGVASTQETKDRPEYTASSGDTSVVTANVIGGNVYERTGSEPTQRPEGSSLRQGDVWVETDTSRGLIYGNETLYKYDGSSYVQEGNGSWVVIRQDSAPTQRDDGSSLQSGDLWLDGAVVNVYDGSSWSEVRRDAYTLELTEQGTGTATITVTGEVPAISASVQTIFDVTIS